MDKNLEYASAFLMFISKEYLQSYATLIELLTAIKYGKPIISICFEDRNTMLKSLRDNFDLIDMEVLMQPGEETRLLNLLKVKKCLYVDTIQGICNDFMEKINQRRLEVLDIVKAFGQIFEAVDMKDNLYDKNIESLINTIKDAAKKENGTEVFEGINDNKQETVVLKEHQAEEDKTKVPVKKKRDATHYVYDEGLSKADVGDWIVKCIGGKHPGEITLKEYSELFDNLDFCILVRKLRDNKEKYKKGVFDYVHAALLRGCDMKLGQGEPRWNYCTYIVSNQVDFENPKLNTGQFTWTSNCRKAVGMENSGKLGENSTFFEQLSADTTLQEIEAMFTAGNKDVFRVKGDAEKVFKAIYEFLDDCVYGRGCNESTVDYSAEPSVKGGSIVNKQEYWKEFIEYAFERANDSKFMDAGFKRPKPSDDSMCYLRFGLGVYIELKFSVQKNFIAAVLRIPERKLFVPLANLVKTHDENEELQMNVDAAKAYISLTLKDGLKREWIEQFKWFMACACEWKDMIVVAEGHCSTE